MLAVHSLEFAQQTIRIVPKVQEIMRIDDDIAQDISQQDLFGLSTNRMVLTHGITETLRPML